LFSIELSRVRNLEKAELKTAASNRRIEIRPSVKKILEEQKKANRGISNSLCRYQYRRKADPPGQAAGTMGTDYQKEPTALPEDG
jgi:hypothetical protein